jgi:cytoskeleton protein RodZ
MQSENLAAVAEAPSSPGAHLRRAREARGESVHEVAFALKLSPRQVDALEHDEFNALPGMAFVRGFMRNYARYVGLDATPLLDAVQRLAGQGSPDLSPIRNADGDLPVGDTRRSGSFPAGLVVLILVAMVVTGWYFDWFRTDTAPSAETVVEPSPTFAPAPTQPVESQSAISPSAIQLTPPQPLVIAPVADAQVGEAAASGDTAALAAATEGESAAPGVHAPAPAPAPASSGDAAPAVTAPSNESAALAEPDAGVTAPVAADVPMPASSGSGQLSFRFGADSWVEVRDAGGTILHSGINRAGSTRSVQGAAPFTLVVGNAASVTLEHDGKPVDLAAHIRGSVARLTLR